MEKTHTVGIKMIFFSVTDGALVAYAPHGAVPARALAWGKELGQEVETIVKLHTGLSSRNGFIEQLYTLSDSSQKFSVTVVYYMLVASHLIRKKLKGDWVRVVDSQKSLSGDQILLYAMQRLRWKIEYTNIVYSLLPKEFTFGELQKVYEAILGRTMDKRNFRKKILSLGILTDTGKKKTQGRSRPAEVYRFKSREMTYVEVL